MQWKSITTAALAGLLLPAGLARADATNEGASSWCGIGAPSDETLQALDSLHDDELLAARDLAASSQHEVRRQTITIPIHMHAVLDPAAAPESIMGDMMQGQLDVMNEAYEPYGIQFQLSTMDLVKDSALANFNTSSFFRDTDGDENAYRVDYLNRTRRGGYDELNIWYYSDMPDGLNGVCMMPVAHAQAKDLWRDGCHIVAGTMPGGDRKGYNIGYTSVHETGHWLGLLHPWGEAEGHCDGPGDRVDDTPPQSKPVFGCPGANSLPSNTCPGTNGVTNADNYMDYAEDSCYRKQKFTPGQETRMHSSYTKLRSQGPSP